MSMNEAVPAFFVVTACSANEHIQKVHITLPCGVPTHRDAKLFSHHIFTRARFHAGGVLETRNGKLGSTDSSSHEQASPAGRGSGSFPLTAPLGSAPPVALCFIQVGSSGAYWLGGFSGWPLPLIIRSFKLRQAVHLGG